MIQIVTRLWLRRCKKKLLLFGLTNLGFALGMVTTFFLGLYVVNELSYNTKVDDYRQKFRLVKENKSFNSKSAGTSYSLAGDIQNEIPGVSEVSVSSKIGGVNVTKGIVPVRVDGMMGVTSNYFDMFSLRVLFGVLDESFNRPSSIILSQSLSTKFFNKQNSVGEKLEVTKGSRKYFYYVVAVVEDFPKNSTIDGKLFVELNSALKNILNPDNRNINWADFQCSTYLKVDPGSTMDAVEGNINKAARKYLSDTYRSVDFKLQRLDKIYLDSNDYQNYFDIRGDRKKVITLSFAAIFFIIICSANYLLLNLALARTRQKESGISIIFGSGPKHLLRKLFIETLLNMATIVIAMIILMLIIAPKFEQALEFELTLPIKSLIIYTLFFMGFIVTIIGISSSLIAIYLLRIDPLLELQSIHGTRESHKLRRRSFVFVQLVMFISITIYSITVFKQINYSLNIDQGFNPKNLFLIRGDILSMDSRKYNQFKEEARNIEHVQLISGGIHLPPTLGSGKQAVYIPGSNAQRTTSLEVLNVDYNFNATYQTELIAGRWFSRDLDGENSSKLILTESAAKALELMDPVGKLIRWVNKDCEIVGLIRDFRIHTLHMEQNPTAIILSPNFVNQIAVRLEPGYSASTINKIKNAYRNAYGASIGNFGFFDEELKLIYKREIQWNNLVVSFTIVAALIICMGLVGLSFFIVDNRFKEVIIRKILGANIVQSLWLIYEEFFWLTFAAFIIAGPISTYLSLQWLQFFTQHVSIGGYVWILSIILTLLIVFIALSYRGLNLAFISTARGIRYE